MNRSFGFVAAWLAGTLVAVFIGAAAVGNVRNEVTDAPTALGVPNTVITVQDEEPEPSSPTSTAGEAIVPLVDSPDESPTTTTTTLPEEPVEPDVTTSTVSDDVTSTAPTTTKSGHDDEPTTTTTTAPPTTTTTTIASYTKTYDVEEAGTVTIRVSGESVTFAGAYPLEGWTFKLKDKGPEEVEVRFSNNDDDEDEVTFKAKMKDGELDVDIND